MSIELEIQLVAVTVSVACSLAGVFLVLRRMALMSDAISHTVLLGIVLVFFITRDIASPFLVVGAAVMGVATVGLVELLRRTRLVREDASIGLVFPALFSIAVILITRYAGSVHLDTDAVLLGEIAFAPFRRLEVGGVDLGPRSLWVMGGILLLNVTFIALLYKELKLSTFDPGLAAALGFAPGILHYAFMTLVSITAVGAFDTVGSILVRQPAARIRAECRDCGDCSARRFLDGVARRCIDCGVHGRCCRRPLHARVPVRSGARCDRGRTQARAAALGVREADAGHPSAPSRRRARFRRRKPRDAPGRAPALEGGICPPGRGRIRGRGAAGEAARRPPRADGYRPDICTEGHDDLRRTGLL
jgi:manganese/zinc/iron transport system permease protein